MIIVKNTWEEVADVCVIGYGMAGTVAAITAADQGAEVLVLEKQPKEGFYTSSSMSGGVFLNTPDKEQAFQYLENLNRAGAGASWGDTDTIRTFVDYAADNAGWLRRLGGDVRPGSKGGEHSGIPGSGSLEVWRFSGKGRQMMKFMYEQAASRRIRVRYATPAYRLISDANGEIIGLCAKTKNGARVYIGVRRGVILAAGGYEYDETMKLNNLKIYPTFFQGTPAATGDGVRMALDAGAALWHMNCCSARWVLKFPEYPWGFSAELGGNGWLRRLRGKSTEPEPAGYVVVDRNGQRFTNEDHKPHSVYYELGLYDSHRLRYPRIPSFWVFDRKRIGAGQICATSSGAAGPQQLYHWSRDNSEELKRGWIREGNTVAELARNIGLPEGELEGTIASYNRACESGRDPTFGRRQEGLTPLDSPPFYALKLWPGGPNTQGGPRRNSRGQVLNQDGEPIRRLYSAGELGSIFGMLYPGAGGNIAECIVFGRIAGVNAADEPPLPV